MTRLSDCRRGPNFAGVSNAASHKSSLLQRLKHTNGTFQPPYGSGMSFHGTPERRTQRMSPTVCRLSRTGGRRSLRPGRNRSGIRHYKSLRSPRLSVPLPSERQLKIKTRPTPCQKPSTPPSADNAKPSRASEISVSRPALNRRLTSRTVSPFCRVWGTQTSLSAAQLIASKSLAA